MAETQRFGLEKFGGPGGGAITDNGGKYSTGDRDTIDRLLAAFERHVHDAPFNATALDDPTDAPAGTIAPTGGTLAGGTTYYYRVSYIDQFGLETAGSDELALTTEDAPIVTDPPVANGDTTAGNTLPPATYYYALTALSSQGESSLGPQAIITTQPGQTGVLLTLPAMTNGITGYNVWRHGISDAGWTKVGINAGATFLDAGVPTGTCLTDPATQPPNTVTFAVTGTHAATITVPDTALVGRVLGPVRGWRLYRTDTSGNYSTESLVAETVAADDATALDTSYVDTGASLLAGRPLLTSTTLAPSRRIFDAGSALPAVTGYPDQALFLNTSVPAFFALIGGAWAQLSPPSSSGGGGGGPYAPGAGPIFIDADGVQWQQGITTAGAPTYTLVAPPTSSGDGSTIAGAFALTTPTGTHVVDSSGNAPVTGASFHPVWYTCKPTTDCVLVADTNGSGTSYDSMLRIYSGPDNATQFSDLTVLASNDDGGDNALSLLSYPLTAGTRYYLCAGDWEMAGSDDAYQQGSHTLTLNWSGFNVLGPASPKNMVAAWSGTSLNVSFTPPGLLTDLTNYEVLVRRDGNPVGGWSPTSLTPPASSVVVTGTPVSGSVYRVDLRSVYGGGLTYTPWVFSNELTAP